jgi:hypothetical protein
MTYKACGTLYPCPVNKLGTAADANRGTMVNTVRASEGSGAALTSMARVTGFGYPVRPGADSDW